jgi:hypothetical protein
MLFTHKRPEMDVAVDPMLLASVSVLAVDDTTS